MEEQIRIERLSYGKAGIGHTKEGKTVFVDRVAPGDLVNVAIVEEKPRYSLAKTIDIIEPGLSRTKTTCPHYAYCGGCPWQQVDYQTQLEAKRANVVSALVRTTGFDSMIADELVRKPIPSKREFGYRNKLELGATYGNTGFELGFRQEDSSDITSTDTCPLAHRDIEKAPKAIRGVLKYLQGTQDLGIFRVGIRSSIRTKSTEIALWTSPGAFPRKPIANTLKNALKVSSIVRVIANPGKARIVKQVEVLDGKGYWEEKLNDNLFKTSAPSFFQVNTAQAELLVLEVLDGLELDDDAVVADLYAGGGTFSIPLAQRVDTVFAVESASTSVKDLRRNTEVNQVYVDVIGGDSGRELPALGHLDALVVDPPRSGLSKETIDAIGLAAPQRIAYVSCDPATLARDLALLQKIGFKLRYIQPIDLFPQTYHVECVAQLER